MNDLENKWWKDLDVGRTVENLLLGSILFIGRYVRTFYYYYIGYDHFISRSIMNPSLKLEGKQDDSRPITYLVVSGFLYLFLVPDQLAVVGEYLDVLSPLTEQIETNIKNFNIGSMASYMLPFIIFVAFYSKIMTWGYKYLFEKSEFKIFLNIHCYFVGSVATVSSLVWLASFDAWEIASGITDDNYKLIPIYALAALQFVVIIVAFWRYIQHISIHTSTSKMVSLTMAISAGLIFSVLSNPLVWMLKRLFEARGS